MTIEFDNSSYFRTYCSKNSFDQKFFKANPQFTYDEPKYSEYTKFYDKSGWFGRKIIALPAAAWSGIAKVIYHLVKAIFLGLPSLTEDDGLCFKSQFFSIPRDVQEAFGRILTFIPFLDCHGMYHVEQAGFYKSCYECFTHTEESSSPPTHHNQSLRSNTNTPTDTSFQNNHSNRKEDNSRYDSTWTSIRQNAEETLNRINQSHSQFSESETKKRLESQEKINSLKIEFKENLTKSTTEYETQKKVIQDKLSIKLKENGEKAAEIKQKMEGLKENSLSKYSLDLELMNLASETDYLQRNLSILNTKFTSKKQQLISNFEAQIYFHASNAFPNDDNRKKFLIQLSAEFPEVNFENIQKQV